MPLTYTGENEFTADLALAARNADFSCLDIFGIRVAPIIDAIGTGVLSWKGTVWPFWCTFGSCISNLRLWVPGALDVEVNTAVVCRGGGTTRSVLAYAFSEKECASVESLTFSIQRRICVKHDVLAWVQAARVADRVEVIPLTHYGYVRDVNDAGVSIVRVSRAEAMNVRDSVSVERRINQGCGFV